jgi:hypothetical protein
MNKKLFSWKALAGLALLVAMGMTSCKNTTEVDPNDPYNVTKPTKPAQPTVVANGGDLTITINSIAALNDSLKTKKATDLIKGNDVINLTIKGLKDIEITSAATISIPAGLDDKTLNVTFAENFKKQTAEVTIEDLNNLCNLNVTLPAGDFGNLKFNTSYATVSLSGSSSNVAELAAALNNKALTLKSGVTVKGMRTAAVSSGKVVVDGGSVTALIVDADVTANKDGNGAAINNVKVANGKDQFYVKTLVVEGNRNVLKADNDNKTTFDKITLAKGADLWFNAKAEEIVGTLDNGAFSSEVWGDLDNVKKISDAIIDQSFTVKSELSNCKLTGTYVYFPKETSGVKGCTFTSNYIYYTVPAQTAPTYTFTYDGCTFDTNTRFGINDYDNYATVKDADGNEVKVKWYRWYVLNDDNTYKTDSIFGTHQEVDPKTGYIKEVKDTTVSYVTAESRTFTDIPAYSRKQDPDGTGAYWWSFTRSSSEKVSDYNDFTVYTAFKDCKIGTKALNETNIKLANDYTITGVKTRYQIGSTTYRAVWNNNQYILIKSE